MKPSRILAASVIAGSLLFTGTACSPKEPIQDPSSSPTASTSATAEPSASPSATVNSSANPDVAIIGPDADSTTPDDAPTETANPVEASDDATAVLEVINSYYAFIISPEAIASIQELRTGFGEGEPTPEQIETVVAAHPEIYKYYDTSTPEKAKLATEEFVMAASMIAMGGSKVTFTAPAESVTVDGDTAKVDASAVIVTVDGEKIKDTTADEGNIDFTKKEGKWVIVAKPLPATP